MGELAVLYTSLRSFEAQIGSNTSAPVHAGNKFNKQFGVILRDYEYLKIIVERLESCDSNDSLQIALDLKSLYVFGRVFSESVVYIASFFIPSGDEIVWSKIGPFVGTVEKNLAAECDELKHFWTKVGGSIRILNSAFKYRNEVLHKKDSDNEWTLARPGRSNLDHISIINVPWPEDQDKKEEMRSLNARNLVQILANEVPKILEYLKLTTVS